MVKTYHHRHLITECRAGSSRSRRNVNWNGLPGRMQPTHQPAPSAIALSAPASSTTTPSPKARAATGQSPSTPSAIALSTPTSLTTTLPDPTQTSMLCARATTSSDFCGGSATSPPTSTHPQSERGRSYRRRSSRNNTTSIRISPSPPGKINPPPRLEYPTNRQPLKGRQPASPQHSKTRRFTTEPTLVSLLHSCEPCIVGCCFVVPRLPGAETTASSHAETSISPVSHDKTFAEPHTFAKTTESQAIWPLLQLLGQFH